MKIIVKGFFFGMILQFSIGPVCLYILNQSIQKGFLSAFPGAMAAFLGDSFFVILALLGTVQFLNHPVRRRFFQRAGAVILFLFSLETGLSAFHQTLFFFLPVKTIPDFPVFLSVLILTLSSPLTALFWSGVFSAKMIEQKFSKKELIFFSAGALSATLIFLSGVALTGRLFQNFLTERFLMVLNLGVACFLMFFTVKLWFFRERSTLSPSE